LIFGQNREKVLRKSCVHRQGSEEGQKSIIASPFKVGLVRKNEIGLAIKGFFYKNETVLSVVQALLNNDPELFEKSLSVFLQLNQFSQHGG